MTHGELFESARYRIHRAGQKISEFMPQAASIPAERYWEVRVNNNAGTRHDGRSIHRLELEVFPTPPELSLMAGEILYSQRTALDHLVSAISRDTTGKTSQKGFPIRENAADLKSAVRELKFIEKFPQFEDLLVNKIGAYRRQGSLLWQLNKLSNADKHDRNLVVASVAKIRIKEVKSGTNSFTNNIYNGGGPGLLALWEHYDPLEFDAGNADANISFRFTDEYGLNHMEVMVALLEIQKEVQSAITTIENAYSEIGAGTRTSTSFGKGR